MYERFLLKLNLFDNIILRFSNQLIKENMAKECYICGKSTKAGKNIQHKHSEGWRYKAPKTNRKFKPNFKKITLEVDGKPKKVTICMKCYKRLRKNESARILG
jgi:large subunit ribosomal protein L28